VGYTSIVMKITTSRYDVAKHLRTPDEMVAYLEACFEEAEGDAAFMAKALRDIARCLAIPKHQASARSKEP
jgi:DNA-binding phage protein